MAIRSAVRHDTPRLTIKHVHNEVHLIADDVFIPIEETERADVEKALALIGRLRDRALKAMHDQDCDIAEDGDKVVFAFDYRIENGNAVVQVAQIAE